MIEFYVKHITWRPLKVVQRPAMVSCYCCEKWWAFCTLKWFFSYIFCFACFHFFWPDGCDADGYHKSKTKRVRTTFTEEQLQVLQANFQIDSNPDGQDLERIASVTGLSKRVTQVWFQNSRARQKKHIHAGKNKSKWYLVTYAFTTNT